jgi:Cellulase (glycosyl hydrolase family 5)
MRSVRPWAWRPSARRLGRPGMVRALALSALWISCVLATACGGGSSSSQTSSPPPAPTPIPNPVAPGPAGQGIPPQYFGLDIFDSVLPAFGTDPWPAFSFGAIRLWDTHTSWLQINTSSGVYDFSILDTWLQLAQQNKVTDIMYTFGEVPVWASSNPNDQTCVVPSSPAGACDPPLDLNPDGSGTNQIWKDFVTAIVTHSNQSTTAHINAWEIWNEPSIPAEWNGTQLQLARMASDAYTIIRQLDPTALVTTPTPVSTSTTPSGTWMSQYIAATQSLGTNGAPGAPYADVITFHGYLSAGGVGQPEHITDTLAGMSSALTSIGMILPIWDTESDWGKDSDLPDPDFQAAFLARFFLVQYSTGASRLYWYQYGNAKFGSLILSGTLQPAAIAYSQVYDWMVGATLSSPCSNTGTVWTCNFTKPGGIQEQAVWDTSQTCSNGTCTTSSYIPDPAYISYADLAGNVTAITPGTAVQVGAKPILLQNQ